MTSHYEHVGVVHYALEGPPQAIERELPRLLQKYKDDIGPDAESVRRDALGLIVFVEDSPPAPRITRQGTRKNESI